MANPNLLEITSILASSIQVTASTTASTLITCATDNLYKVVSIYCANKTTTTQSVTIIHNNSTTDYYIANQIDIPPDSTLQLVDKNTPLYVTENEIVKCLASAASSIDVNLYYEAMS